MLRLHNLIFFLLIKSSSTKGSFLTGTSVLSLLCFLFLEQLSLICVDQSFGGGLCYNNGTFYVQRWCRTFRSSVTWSKVIWTDVRTHCYLEVIMINRSSSRKDVFLTLGGVESQYSNMRKNSLLFWVPSIVVTTPHSTVRPARHISNNICVSGPLLS